jgi:hypothetical protein
MTFHNVRASVGILVAKATSNACCLMLAFAS